MSRRSSSPVATVETVTEHLDRVLRINMALPNLSGLSLSLSRHATAPTGVSHKFPPEIHYKILWESIKSELDKGTPIWEASISETILNYAAVGNAGRSTEWLTADDVVVDDEAFQMLYQKLREHGAIPLNEGFAWQIGVSREKDPTQSTMRWMLDMCQKVKDKRDAAIEYIKGGGNMLEYDGQWLRDDRDVALAASKAAAVKNKAGMAYVSPRLRNNMEFMIEALDVNPNEYESASYDLQNDVVFVLTAIGTVKDKFQGYGPLYYAGDDVRDKMYVVLAAIHYDKTALAWASEDLKNNQSVVFNAIHENPRQYRFASDELKSNKRVVLAAVRRDGTLIDNVPESMRADDEIMLAAVKQTFQALYSADKRQLNNADIVLAAVEQEVYMMRFAGKDLRDNKEFALAVLAKKPELNPRLLFYLSDRLRSDEEFLREAGLPNQA